MRCHRVMRTLCGLAFALFALGERTGPRRRPRRGKDKAEACTACHGEAGISQTENIPSLAGQPDQFLQWQLVFFRGGARKNEQMQPIAEQIGNEDVRHARRLLRGADAAQGDRARQHPDLSKKGAQAAVGRPLRVVPHRYFMRARKRWRGWPASARNIWSRRCTITNRAARTGGAGAAMTDVAYPLSDEEIEALAHYLAHL